MKCCLRTFALSVVVLPAIAMLPTAHTSFSAFAQTMTTTAPTSSALSEASIKALQEALSRQGIAIKADGILNDETRAAIRKYQSQHHLPVTGEPDKATLDKLGVSVASGTPPASQAAVAPGMTGPRMGPQMMQNMPQGMMGPGMMRGRMPMAGVVPMQQDMMMMCPMMGEARGAMGLGIVTPSRDVSVDDVRHHFDRVLQRQGNPRLKLGDIKEADKDMIVADIVTSTGSLVDRFDVNRRSGMIQRAQ